MKIIGIGNKARQGKDTAAEVLNKLIPNSKILHWADCLYNECRNESCGPLIMKCSNGFMVKDVDNKYIYLDEHSDNNNIKQAFYELQNIMHEDKYFGMTTKDAKLLQWWGTDYRRNLFGENYWIEQLFDTMCSYSKSVFYVPDDSFVFIIPDTRFKNEYDFIKKNNGIFIKIERYNDNNVRFVANDRDPNHLSEIDLDEVTADIYFSNNSTLEKFQKTIEMFVKNDAEFIDFINGQKVEDGSIVLGYNNKK